MMDRMQEKNNTQPLDKQFLESMEQIADFKITPCQDTFDLEDERHFTKLQISSAQKMYVSALVQQIPTAMTAGVLANAYTVSFPQGLPHTLTALNQGGFGSAIRDNGKIVGSASFYQMGPQAAILGAFTAMSIVTGQYFLTQINSELKMINLKIDKILEFLYGDKKAELLSEISFAQYAYKNYNSIMSHEQQRIATLVNLQASKKVALKDIEFYIGDLEAAVKSEVKYFTELEEVANRAFQIRESLELSSQLYTISSILEAYYAQNLDPEYMKNTEIIVSEYIKKCDTRMFGSFSVLKNRIEHYKTKPLEKVDKSIFIDKMEQLLHQLGNTEESIMQKTIRTAFHVPNKKAEYYISADGNMYTKGI